MPKINEIKEQKTVVSSVGNFANSLQQIATMRMVSLRKSVLNSRRFVDEATVILRELKREKRRLFMEELHKVDKNLTLKSDLRKAIIVMSSSQGLCGSYNTEIAKKLDNIVPKHLDADFFVIGSKGQDIFRKYKKKMPNLKFYPYDVPEEVSIEDLRRLVTMFIYYDQVHLVYSKYINTNKREIVFLELAEPVSNTDESNYQKSAESDLEGRFMFEPDIDRLIENVSSKLRYALFRQQLLDAKLSLYSAQMIAMQTASDNSVELLKDLQMQYNKARRKLIDKKIQEVQAGRALWA